MSFLLDTNVVSETRKRVPDGNVMAWLQRTDQKDLFVSVLTLGELAKGVAKLAKSDPVAASSLGRWLGGIVELFSDRIVAVDTPIAFAWGRLNADRSLPAIDSLLAASALVRGLTLVTRNVKHVEATGVALLDPWQHRR